MKRKIFSILFALVLTVSLMLVPATPVSAATPIYVDGVNGDDGNSGTSWAEAKATIIAGISVVDSGGTVYVAVGTYNETVTIGKSLTLTGDPGDSAAGPGPNAPILDGNGVVGSAITIAGGVSNVTIEGFEIHNYRNRTLGASWTTGGIGSAILAWNSTAINNVTIRDNDMHDLGWSAVLVGNEGQALHDNWLVENNVVEDWAAYAIELTNTKNSNVIGNEITGGTGILGESGDNSQDAIVIQTQIHTGSGLTNTSITVDHNNINGPLTRAGIEILAWDSTNSLTAVLNNITVSNNSVGGAARGIYVLSVLTNADISNLSINGNVLDGNADGIQIRDLWGGTHGSITISQNQIINSTGASSGVHLRSGTSAASITVNYNHIVGNANYGINNEGSGTLDAKYNWWGDCSGPGPVGPGTGDSVSANVDYDPWLGQQLCALKVAITELSDNAFNKQNAASDQRQALLDKVDAVLQQIDDGAYRGALNKLERDVGKKLEKWLVSGETLLNMVDAEITILENF